MFTTYRRRWQLSRVEPGDGTRLPEYRPWQVLTRSLFRVDLADPDGRRHSYEVDVRPGADGSTRNSPVSLYRDGLRIARAGLPTTLPVPDGVIEVAANQYGIRRIHHVAGDGTEHLLQPHPRSLEGLRARFGRRFPRISAAVGVVAVAVVLVVGAIGLLKGIDTLTHSPAIAARLGSHSLGTFTTPIRLSTGGTIALGLAGALAATERALAFRSRWTIDRRSLSARHPGTR
jgi:hypothetical protein